MGTHPIFESDFDCLTDSTGLIKIKMARNSANAGGVMKHSRSKMYSRRAQHKRTKTVTKVEKKAAGAVTEQKKADQKAVDAGILSALSADKFLKGYLATEFGLSRGQYPHNMKF